MFAHFSPGTYVLAGLALAATSTASIDVTVKPLSPNDCSVYPSGRFSVVMDSTGTVLDGNGPQFSWYYSSLADGDQIISYVFSYLSTKDTQPPAAGFRCTDGILQMNVTQTLPPDLDINNIPFNGPIVATATGRAFEDYAVGYNLNDKYGESMTVTPVTLTNKATGKDLDGVYLAVNGGATWAFRHQLGGDTQMAPLSMSLVRPQDITPFPTWAVGFLKVVAVST